MKKKLRHIYTNLIGEFVEKKKGLYGEITIIRLNDGRKYYAPTDEFEEYKSDTIPKLSNFISK